MSPTPDLQTLKPAEAAAVLQIGTKALRNLDPVLKPIYLNSRVKRYPAKTLRDFIGSGGGQSRNN